MKRLMLLGLVASMIAGFSGAALADDNLYTVTGELIDSKCYLGKGAMGDGHKGCAVACAKQGIPAAVLAGDGTIYMLAHPAPDFADYMAMQVRITGKRFGENIIPAKFEILKDGKWQVVKLGSTMM